MVVPASMIPKVWEECMLLGYYLVKDVTRAQNYA